MRTRDSPRQQFSIPGRGGLWELVSSTTRALEPLEVHATGLRIVFVQQMIELMNQSSRALSQTVMLE
ncbi:hypothetical protein LguiA_022470 [Lonicera macranthoides]